MTEDKLLPCPFCGRPGQLEPKEVRYTRDTVFSVRCITSQCPGHPVMPVRYDSKNRAIKAWNRRSGNEAAAK